MNQPVLGAVCVSRAGRDKGRAFVLVGVCDESYVLLADGEVRRLERPKRKKLMHLRVEPRRAEELGERLRAGEAVLDADVRKALCALGYNVDSKD